MNRNDTGIDRNDTGMNRNGTGIDRNDKGIEFNTQITLTATRVDHKRRKSVVHVIANNMSHINRCSFFRARLALLLIFLQKNCALTRARKNGTVMSLWRDNRELKHRRS